MGEIIDALVGQYQNPFDSETVRTSLINIVTEQVATQEVEESLTGLQETGKAHMKNFSFVCELIAAGALKQNNTIILAGGFASGETVKLVTNSGVVMMPHLFSTQEEADTQTCDDTDVLMLLLIKGGLYHCTQSKQ